MFDMIVSSIDVMARRVAAALAASCLDLKRAAHERTPAGSKSDEGEREIHGLAVGVGHCGMTMSQWR